MLKQEDLHQFTGTETWYRHALVRAMLYTEGVKYFAESAGNGAYWFLDIVATELMPLLKEHPFIHIVLKSAGIWAALVAGDGNNNGIYQRLIESTDCPEGDWHFYLTNNVLLLPSEY